MSEPYWVALGPKASPVDYVGDWAAGTPYVPGQVVRHNGADHLAVNPSTGQAPTGPGSGVLPVIGMGIALPSSPFDGQEFILVDSLTAPTYSWRLRYVAAKATNKWVFIGGPPLLSYVVTGESFGGSGAYVALTTPGPSVTIPVAGTYLVELFARWHTSSGASATDLFHSYSIAGAAALDADAAVRATPATSAEGQNIRGAYRALPAGALVSQYKATANTYLVSQRQMKVTPVAVG